MTTQEVSEKVRLCDSQHRDMKKLNLKASFPWLNNKEIEKMGDYQLTNHTKPTITQKEPKTSINAQKLLKIRQWASEQQGESAEYYMEKTYYSPELDNFIFDIKDLQKKIYIIQGLSGSGKSYTSKIIAEDLRREKNVVEWKFKKNSFPIANIIKQLALKLPKGLICKLIQELKQFVPKNKLNSSDSIDTLFEYCDILILSFYYQKLIFFCLTFQIIAV